MTFGSPIWFFFWIVSTNEHVEHGISPFDGHTYVTTLLMRLVKFSVVLSQMETIFKHMLSLSYPFNLDPSCQYFMIHPPKLLPAHTFHFRDWNICRFHRYDIFLREEQFFRGTCSSVILEWFYMRWKVTMCQFSTLGHHEPRVTK